MNDELKTCAWCKLRAGTVETQVGTKTVHAHCANKARERLRQMARFLSEWGWDVDGPKGWTE